MAVNNTEKIAMATATQHIRAETRHLHRALEDAPLARELMSPTLSAERYMRIPAQHGRAFQHDYVID